MTANLLLSHPSYFYGLLFLLFGITLLLVLLPSIKSAGQHRRLEEEIKYADDKIRELEYSLSAKEAEYKQKLYQAQSIMQAASEDLRRRNSSMESELVEKDQIKESLLQAQSTVAQQEEELKALRDSSQESENKLKVLQAELARVGGELSLKEQICDGLKGQYDELEKDFFRMVQKLDGQKTSVNPQPALSQGVKNIPQSISN